MFRLRNRILLKSKLYKSACLPFLIPYAFSVSNGFNCTLDTATLAISVLVIEKFPIITRYMPLHVTNENPSEESFHCALLIKLLTVLPLYSFTFFNTVNFTL